MWSQQMNKSSTNKRRPKGVQRQTHIRTRATREELKLVREFAKAHNTTVSELLREQLVAIGALPDVVLTEPLTGSSGQLEGEA